MSNILNKRYNNNTNNNSGNNNINILTVKIIIIIIIIANTTPQWIRTQTHLITSRVTIALSYQSMLKLWRQYSTLSKF
jgi:hypothetical protein